MMKSSSVDTTFAPIAMFRKASLMIIALAATTVFPQTFEIGGQQAPQQTPQTAKKRSGRVSSAVPPATAQVDGQDDSALSFGTGLSVQREVRAADDSLKHNNPGAAYTHAKRATETAPNDKSSWFTLGYAARLSGPLSDSEAASRHGLQIS